MFGSESYSFDRKNPRPRFAGRVSIGCQKGWRRYCRYQVSRHGGSGIRIGWYHVYEHARNNCRFATISVNKQPTVFQ